jgi:hypothetical protein
MAAPTTSGTIVGSDVGIARSMSFGYQLANQRWLRVPVEHFMPRSCAGIPRGRMAGSGQ